MRPAIIILGLVLAVVGGALVLSPISQSTSVTITGPTAPSAPFGMKLPYSITDTILYNITWTGATNTTSVYVYGCGTTEKCKTGLTLLASVSSSSGAFTVGVAPGNYIVLNASQEVNITVAASTAGAYGLAGVGPLVIGMVMIAYGWTSYPSGTPERPASSRRLDGYLAAMTILLVVLGMLAGYMLTLGPLNSEGSEDAFGFALGMSMLAVGLIFHILDVVYRDRAIEIRRQLKT